MFVTAIAWLPDEGRVVRRGEYSGEGPLLCAYCGAALKTKNKYQFEHPEGRECTHGTSMREGAKLLALRAMGSDPRPMLMRKCTVCGHEGRLPLPSDVVAAVDHGEGIVALLDTQAIVRATISFALDIPWGSDVPQQEIPHMVLDVLDLCSDPSVWPARGDALRPFKCPACEETKRALQERQRIVAAAQEQERRERARVREQLVALCRKYDLPMGGNGYFCAPYSCFRCSAPMVVYRWRGHRPQEPDVPPEPIPRTVQWRYTQQLGDSYWANVCPECDVVQGDHYLYSVPGGPFWRGRSWEFGSGAVHTFIRRVGLYTRRYR